MARAPALVLKSLGFKVSAWVRNPRAEGDVPIHHGPDQLELFLQQTDIAVCLLPLTRETEGIFCTRTFAMMPRGAMLVNVGRGKHVVDEDLITRSIRDSCHTLRWTRCGPSLYRQQVRFGCTPELP
jgi:glyoxylate/hydroxypyruvate reductase A